MSTPIDVNWDSEFSYRGCGSGGGGGSGEGGAGIDDSAVSGSTTWSSAKITDEQQALEDRLTEAIEAIDTECHVIDDSEPSESTAYSSAKVESLIEAIPNPIDDSEPSESTAYSSAKVESLIEAIPNPIDDSVTADDKTWSGEKVASEIDQKIADSAANKLDRPASVTVGTYLRVASIDETGTPVLEAVGLPVATGTKEGLVSASADFGTEINTAPEATYIGTVQASESDLHSRINAHRVVCPANIDIAVKTAMCDGKGASWSAADQRNARERQGIYVMTQTEYGRLGDPDGIYIIVEETT